MIELSVYRIEFSVGEIYIDSFFRYKPKYDYKEDIQMKYLDAEMEVVDLIVEDVITASGDIDDKIDDSVDL